MLSNKNISYMSWTVALISMLISLVFSDILKFPPCTLCWYQRIFMYPLVFIIPVGILSKDQKVHVYSLVLSSVGLVIASYHSMIYHGIIQETLKVCTADLSCKTKQFELFDLISIPVMSLVSFSFIFILNLQGVRNVKRA